MELKDRYTILKISHIPICTTGETKFYTEIRLNIAKYSLDLANSEVSNWLHLDLEVIFTQNKNHLLTFVLLQVYLLCTLFRNKYTRCSTGSSLVTLPHLAQATPKGATIPHMSLGLILAG